MPCVRPQSAPGARRSARGSRPQYNPRFNSIEISILSAPERRFRPSDRAGLDLHAHVDRVSRLFTIQAKKIPSTKQCSFLQFVSTTASSPSSFFLVRASRTTSFRVNTLKKRDLLLHHDSSAGGRDRMPAPLQLTRCHVPAIGSRAICSTSCQEEL